MMASSLHTVIMILVMPQSPATVFPSLTAVLNSVEESVCNNGSVCSFPTHLSYERCAKCFFLLGLMLELNLRLDMRLGDVWFMINVMSTLTHVDIQDAHLPHRAVTKPARLPPSLLAHAAIGNTGPVCPAWLAGQCAVCPGGARVTRLSCCCCHWPQPSELLSYSDPRQHTVCCFIRSLHHL